MPLFGSTDVLGNVASLVGGIATMFAAIVAAWVSWGNRQKLNETKGQLESVEKKVNGHTQQLAARNQQLAVTMSEHGVPLPEPHGVDRRAGESGSASGLRGVNDDEVIGVDVDNGGLVS